MKQSFSRFRLLPVAVLVLVCPLLHSAASQSIYRFSSGVHLSHEQPLSARQVQLLLGQFQELTGFQEIQFDPAGDLKLGKRSLFENGSLRARELLMAALDGGDSFTLENAYHSPAVAFAQIEDVVSYVDGDNEHHHDWRIRIDFADFKELRGDNGAIASFSPGVTVFHELVHAVLGLSDPVDRRDELGSCERYVNQIRAALGLAQRLSYYPRNRVAVSAETEAQILQGSLVFARIESATEKRKEFRLTFNIERIFDVSKARTPYYFQPDLLAQRRE